MAHVEAARPHRTARFPVLTRTWRQCGMAGVLHAASRQLLEGAKRPSCCLRRRKKGDHARAGGARASCGAGARRAGRWETRSESANGEAGNGKSAPGRRPLARARRWPGRRPPRGRSQAGPGPGASRRAARRLARNSPETTNAGQPPPPPRRRRAVVSFLAADRRRPRSASVLATPLACDPGFSPQKERSAVPWHHERGLRHVRAEHTPADVVAQKALGA